MRWLCPAALACLLASGCHIDPVPDRGPLPLTEPTPVHPLPTDPPVPVPVPGPPPPPRPEPEMHCDDGQVAVPGQWEWAGEWVWCSGYCALAQAGHVWISARYDNGFYVRGYYAQVQGSSPLSGLKPSYMRLVHPPDLVLGPASKPQAVAGRPSPEAEPSSPPVYFWGGPWGWPGGGWRQAPLRPPRAAGTGERPPPPRGLGERP
ncbi:MAG: hypothetical protein RMK29_19465 [Myxococcales bacterium]|nr:hypothetical protein [Myxococcales bacterium]